MNLETLVPFIPLIELLLLGITAVITLFAAIYVGKQAEKHFRMQRSTAFIERFNSGDLLRIRPEVDQLLATVHDWQHELRRAAEGEPESNHRVIRVSVFANFFQELATAFIHRTIDEAYTWDVFGGLVKKYWRNLAPFVEAIRLVNERPTLYDDFQHLAERMGRVDRKKNA